MNASFGAERPLLDVGDFLAGLRLERRRPTASPATCRSRQADRLEKFPPTQVGGPRRDVTPPEIWAFLDHHSDSIDAGSLRIDSTVAGLPGCPLLLEASPAARKTSILQSLPWELSRFRTDQSVSSVAPSAPSAPGHRDANPRRARPPRRPTSLSLAVHEFRTPVTVVAGLSADAGHEQAGPLADAPDALILEAEKSCARLTALVAELSDLANLEGATAALAREDVVLDPIVDEVIASSPRAAIEASPSRAISQPPHRPSPATASDSATSCRPCWWRCCASRVRRSPSWSTRGRG